jgi:RNA polymerase sigma-70 factor (ECF subfamily)
MRPFHDARLQEIETLYRRRFAHFVRVATAITADRELALEAVQDAFAAVVKSRRRYRGEGPLEAWVWRAVVNAAQKARLRSVRPIPVEDADVRRNGHDPAAASELLPLIALLPERQRLALFLRYFADLDYRSIAAALDVEVGTVSATLSSAHASLRRSLGEVPR